MCGEAQDTEIEPTAEDRADRAVESVRQALRERWPDIDNPGEEDEPDIMWDPFPGNIVQARNGAPMLFRFSRESTGDSFALALFPEDQHVETFEDTEEWCTWW